MQNAGIRFKGRIRKPDRSQRDGSGRNVVVHFDDGDIHWVPEDTVRRWLVPVDHESSESEGIEDEGDSEEEAELFEDSSGANADVQGGDASVGAGTSNNSGQGPAPTETGLSAVQQQPADTKTCIC